MGLSLPIVIVAAILASIALFFLLGSSVSEHKKHQILLIMGLLIFLSIVISNFKSRDIITFSLLNSSASRNSINSLFTDPLPAYIQKYPLDPGALGDQLLDRNYWFHAGSKNYTQLVAYISEKDNGASMFMHQLAQRYRAKGVPAFYIKMESPWGSCQEFFSKTQLSSYEAFRSSLEYYTSQGIRPYVLVDNAELLPRAVWDILSIFTPERCPHMILNTQNIEALVERLNETDYSSRIHSARDSLLGKFQMQKFVGPDHTILSKLASPNWSNTKLPLNFHIINQFKNGCTEQEILLKRSQAKLAVADYFGLISHYNLIRKLLQAGPISVGKLKQSGIPYERFQQMQQLRLVAVKNAEVTLG